MEEVNGEHMTWKQELASLVEFPCTMDFGESASGDRFQLPISEVDPAARGVGEAIREFARGLGEVSMELAKSFGDVVKQNFGDEESFVMRKLGKPCGRIFGKLSFLNEYLPEDRNPFHSWGMIFLVFFVAMTGCSKSYLIQMKSKGKT